MENEPKLLWWIFFTIPLLISNMQNCAYGEPQVPCYFVFGDSLFDNGNNNNLSTLAKANYTPYGFDFSKGPTGRFSNGNNTADVIGKLLGFDDYIPTFNEAKATKNILRGVNYASGSAGIRNESGLLAVGDVISMDEQLQNHRVIISLITEVLGNKDSAMKHLSKCIYTIDMGNNDYTMNYFLPQLYNTSRQFNVHQYATVLIQQYSQQLKSLYDLGARKVAVAGLLQSGCSPNALATYGTNGSSCVEMINNAIDAESTRAFRFTRVACCNLTSTGLCDPSTIPCPDRTQYAFYDSAHPTEARALILGRRAYRVQSLTDAFPVDISLLAQL
uniref:GDSL esterase/lipase n=1 Tax=Populus alba TaxID=43335 RepID=A0A4U5PNG7_POPAL|nr:GDSL esterase/lipase [Populus alba]